MAVLLCLAEQAGDIISRDTSVENVWAPAVVSDDALNRCTADFRRILGDRKTARFIETAPNRCLERFTDGVFFVDLSSLGDDTLIGQQIAEPKELPPDSGSLSAISH